MVLFRHLQNTDNGPLEDFPCAKRPKRRTLVDV